MKFRFLISIFYNYFLFLFKKYFFFDKVSFFWQNFIWQNFIWQNFIWQNFIWQNFLFLFCLTKCIFLTHFFCLTKLFWYQTSILNIFSIFNIFFRTKRDVKGFSLDGNENPAELLSILSAVTGDAEDEIDQLIAAMTGTSIGKDRTPPTAIQTRKFRNLKILVLWLQKEQKFGKYCYYGCFCLPEG